MHSWIISAASRNDGVPWVVAVCTTCGVIRMQNAPGPQHERHVDLRGACPGQPQEPTDKQVEKRVDPPEPQEPMVALGR